MKVILTQDIPRVGRQYDVVEVANGYANNFLLPQNLAEPATDARVAELEKKREALQAEEAARLQALTEKLESLTDATVTIHTKCDDQGHLYKKLHAADISEALLNQLEIELPETAILLDSPLNETGEHEVAIEAADMKVTLTVVVAKEGEETDSEV